MPLRSATALDIDVTCFYYFTEVMAALSSGELFFDEKQDASRPAIAMLPYFDVGIAPMPLTYVHDVADAGKRRSVLIPFCSLAITASSMPTVDG